jgi:hypothetical protein
MMLSAMATPIDTDTAATPAKEAASATPPVKAWMDGRILGLERDAGGIDAVVAIAVDEGMHIGRDAVDGRHTRAGSRRRQPRHRR